MILWEFNTSAFIWSMACFSCCFLLLLGCGSGLSGETLSENGHHWIGFDISQSMLGLLIAPRKTDILDVLSLLFFLVGDVKISLRYCIGA